DQAKGYRGVLAGTFRISYGGQSSNEFDINLPPGGVVPSVPRDSSAAIQIDSQLVHLILLSPIYVAVTPIHVTILNPRSDTSFIVNCDGETRLSLEKQTRTQWAGARSARGPLCLSPPHP